MLTLICNRSTSSRLRKTELWFRHRSVRFATISAATLLTILILMPVRSLRAWGGTPHSFIIDAALTSVPAQDRIAIRLGGEVRHLRNTVQMGDWVNSLIVDRENWHVTTEDFPLAGSEYFGNDYLLFPKAPHMYSHVMPYVAETYTPFFSRSLQALRTEDATNATRWMGALLHFVTDSGSPSHTLPVLGPDHTKMENWLDASTIDLRGYHPVLLGRTDTEALEGLQTRMAGLIARNKIIAQKMVRYAQADDRAHLEPLALDCATETAKVVADVIHTLLILSLTGPGNVTVTANQPGNDDFAAATPVSWTITVAQPAAAIALTSSTNPALAQSSISFTAVVSMAHGTPTGTVTFFDGTTVLGNVAIVSGTASYNTSNLAAGAHQITASYSGDANFGPVRSAVLTETVEDLGFAPSSSSAASTNQTVSPGGTATYALTLSPTGSATFSSAVSLSVSGLPPGATYTLTPESIAAGALATNVTLNVKLPVTSALMHRKSLFGSPFASLALGILILPLSLRSRRFSLKTRGIFVLLLAATINLGGCSSGGSSNSSPGTQTATPQSYTLTLTATSGSLVRTMDLTLTVK
ncbi:Ig-like domain repeat protein [Edaphobacter sp. HDX4]|uniref:Ig-like domain repeat protein n=1 Tax=Edaphobacter sp. HDX4 TaxID=2794064 RepID=UPI002FE63060